ncbi:MAG: alpha/beta hydrolase [Ignavibacteriaceae bacterium]|nr:alpha/beta hydrolase [Ignavibacterium sp.]MCC6255278.1 alpha/beta hydrolase [Ignavibacteriaceae bacterium]HRN26040.1 alpha/beta hydrolase [Ignavibacteriaceae bacterium]HRP92620.1 alpha/beta hydrolase [Ignavibacteriaceae bacterium]HRQ53150.1 alpha/beta hydrolase [Ignavibacteriaceae bacterium]
MKIFLFVISFFTLLFFAGCSGGYLYWDKPALQFSEIDYGYPTKSSLNYPKISYIDQGSGDKTIILVHGLASNAGFWRYNIPELAKKYRVIAVDLPGYGKSQKDNYLYSMSFYADQIKKLVDDLQLKNVVYVGHSMGGQIGIKLAIKYPNLISKLILASPAGFERFQRGEGDWLRSVMTMKGVKSTTEEGIRRNLAMNFYNWNDKWEWMVEERVRMRKATDFDEFAYTVVRCVNGMLDEPTFDKLSLIKTPTLVIYGRYDGLIPNPYLNPGCTSDVFENGAKDISNVKLIELDNAGHMIQIEKADEFNQAVLDYLK